MKIDKNFLMVSNYNADISWILNYTDNYIIYDRSDTDEWIKLFDPKKVIKVPNIGWDIYDKFTYIIDNYDNLPESMIMTKGNIFKYITKDEFDEICNNTFFTPIFTKNHKTYKPVCFYGEDGMYNEINNSWYLRTFPAKYFKSYNQFIKSLGLETTKYLKFAPGSNYLVTKENIHKHPRAFYEKLRQCVDYSAHPGEAQIIERFLYTLWTTDKTFKPEMLKLVPQNLFLRFSKKLLSFLVRKNVLKKNKKLIKYILNNIQNFLNYIKKPFEILGEYKQKRNWLTKEEISDHRKKIKIYDIFLFFNELELLEIRLEILGPCVDYFIIVEATKTFSGNPKPLYYETNKELYKKWNHKIIHYVIKDTPETDADPNCDQKILAMANESSNVPKGQMHWLREFYQKEMMKKPLVNMLKDDDFCFVSDVDEIWNPNTTIDYSQDIIFKFKQKVYAYYLNNRSNEQWAGTFATKYKNIKNNSLNHLDTPSKTKYVYIKNGGWHFTNIGGAERIKQKIESYGHQEFNTENIKLKLNKQIEQNKDYIGRNFKFWIDDSDLPEYLIKNKEKYKKLFK